MAVYLCPLHLGAIVSPSGSPWKCNEISLGFWNQKWTGSPILAFPNWIGSIWPCSSTFLLPMQKCWLRSLADDFCLCLTTSSDAVLRGCLSSGGSDQWQCGPFLQALLAPSNHFISSLRSLLTLGLYLLSLGWAKVHVIKMKALGQFSKLEQPHSVQ